MPSIPTARFASLVRRWIAGLGAVARELRLGSAAERLPDGWRQDYALRPAYARIRVDRGGDRGQPRRRL